MNKTRQAASRLMRRVNYQIKQWSKGTERDPVVFAGLKDEALAAGTLVAMLELPFPRALWALYRARKDETNG